ncbi:hypothetical protein WICMUC_004906 [Wickerhamomyces mucosus]|uniref:Major facilitator superfamily (MFS) profile domain-containing protein n=1 Tax=Wickerhamomyces mucosus TaxID=1378264 RepID=A0A9P8PDH8_9ASCO|nr:hypothetical protein WICMUC_004906 [Wickerhamomyces mucosus]
MAEYKEQFEVEVNSVEKPEESRKPFNKWRFLFFNSDDHPDNDTLFDGEPYTIDNMLQYESDGFRLDKSKLPFWKKFLGFCWDGYFLAPSERKYLFKLDFFLFFYSIIAQFIKDLDQSAILNSYVSGMKEDLNMYGANDYNLLTTYFNIGYLATSILMSALAKTLRPSFFLPLCEVFWTIIVMSSAAATTKYQIFGLRFIQGIAEAASFPGLVMVITEWYSVESLGKRVFMLDATSSVSAMFAGYIQTGAYTHLNGKYGIPGWKWVFIIDGIISMPVSVIGFFCLPDFPQNSRASWLNKKDRQFALSRAKAHKKVKPAPMTVQAVIKVFFNPKLYLFISPYVLGLIGSIGFNYLALYLKSLGTFSVQQINLIPTAENAVTFLSMLIAGALSDYFGNRVAFLAFHHTVGIICCILLSIWHFPSAFLIFIYIFSGTSFSQTITISWFAETFYDEPDLKGLSIGIGNTLIFAFTAFLPLAIFKTKDAPHYPIGYQVSIVFWVTSAISNVVFYFYAKNHNKKRLEANVIEEQEKGEVDKKSE